MSKYLLLLYGDERRWENLTPQESAEIDAGHVAFQKRAGDRILASGQLEPSSATATTVRGGGADAPTVTDGPFLETKEVVGGFYLVEAACRTPTRRPCAPGRRPESRSTPPAGCEPWRATGPAT